MKEGEKGEAQEHTKSIAMAKQSQWFNWRIPEKMKLS